MCGCVTFRSVSYGYAVVCVWLEVCVVVTLWCVWLGYAAECVDVFAVVLMRDPLDE